MWLADGWKDYEVIDSSDGEKLERWGQYILVRPDPQVIWDTPRTDKRWKHPNAHYHRSKKGGGEWEFFDLPEQWQISYKNLTFNLKPFNFKHTGLFPEQATNWDWFSEKIRNAGRPVKVLNLFAYTGGATLAAAAAGAFPVMPERTCLTISSIFTLFISMIYVPPDQRMQRLSAITQRLLLVNVLAQVRPSPVRLAIVNVQ